MDRNVGLVSRHVGRAHRAMQVDQNVRKRLLEFDEAGRQPEGPQALGDGDPDLARQRVGDGIAGAQQVEGGGLHAFHRRHHLRAFVGQPGAVDVAGEQGGADLPLEIGDAPAHAVDGKVQPLRGGPETAAADHFQENPGGVPIRETTDSLWVFLLRNAPFHDQTHTDSFPEGKLAEYGENHNHCGSRGWGFRGLYLPCG